MRKGRPRKRPQDRKTKLLTVRVTDHQRRAIRAAAKQAGLSVSELVVRSILGSNTAPRSP